MIDREQKQLKNVIELLSAERDNVHLAETLANADYIDKVSTEINIEFCHTIEYYIEMYLCRIEGNCEFRKIAIEELVDFADRKATVYKNYACLEVYKALADENIDNILIDMPNCFRDFADSMRDLREKYDFFIECLNELLECEDKKGGQEG